MPRSRLQFDLAFLPADLADSHPILTSEPAWAQCGRPEAASDRKGHRNALHSHSHARRGPEKRDGNQQDRGFFEGSAAPVILTFILTLASVRKGCFGKLLETRKF